MNYFVVEIESCCYHFSELHGPFQTPGSVADKLAAIESESNGSNHGMIYAMDETGTLTEKRLSEI